MYINDIEELTKKLIGSKVIICDLDGTLGHSEIMHFDAWKDTLKTYTGVEITDADIKRYISHDDYAICNMFKEDYKKDFNDEFIIEKRREKFIEYLNTFDMKKCEVIYDFIKNTNIGKRNRYLVSSQDINIGLLELSNLNLSKDFDESFWNVKSKEDIYKQIKETCKVDKGITSGFVLFEDSLKYLEIAKKLGFKVIGIEHEYNKDKFKKYLEEDTLDIIKI